MDAKSSVHVAFDKHRVRFADWIVQYGMGFVLLLVALIASSYYIVSTQYQSHVQQVNALHSFSYTALDLSHTWEMLETNEQKVDANISKLLQQEQQLVRRLRAQLSNTHNLPSAPVSISQFTPAEQVHLAQNRLQQLHQIALNRSAVMAQKSPLSLQHIWLLCGGWSCLVVYLIWGWRRNLADRRTALRFFHSQIDKAQSGMDHLTVPITRNDEFGEFARYLDSVLSSITHEYKRSQSIAHLYESALASSLSYKLLLNANHEVMAVSEGFSELWVLEPAALSEVLGVDEHLDYLIGEIVNEDVSLAQTTNYQRVGKRLFELKCLPLTNELSGYLIELVPQEPYSELKVLDASLSLMANDVWNAPIRILDESSPYIGFSRKLETLRQNVMDFIESLSNSLLEVDKEYPKVTKLQQLSTLVIARLNAIEESTALVSEQSSVTEQLVSEIDVSKQDFLQVREQIEQRFELYEAYLQQLTELQAAQASWVASVTDSLVDSKRAVLSLLNLISDDQKSASEIEHSVIDLTHDIDAVLTEVLESKPVAKGLGIEHIKGSESELMLSLNTVQVGFDRIIALAQTDES